MVMMVVTVKKENVPVVRSGKPQSGKTNVLM